MIEAHYERVVLDREEYQVRIRISEALAGNAKFNYHKQVMGDLIATMVSTIASETLEEVVISHPATWWDAVKLRFFPARLLARYPVEKKFIRVSSKALYPNVSIPELDPIVVTRFAEAQSARV